MGSMPFHFFFWATLYIDLNTLKNYLISLLSELFLDNEAMNRVRDFEEAGLELYLRDKESERQVSSEERLRDVAER